MQDPDDDCVAWKPELSKLLCDGQLLEVVIDAYQSARQRIAELEARTITLPQRLQPGADGYDDWYVHSADDGEYLKVDDVIAAIRAAGIGVKGE
nr:hypothetical protein [Citrobacter sp. FDAARGOS_156]